MIKNQPGLKISAKTGIIIFIAFTLLITIPALKKYYDYLTKFKQTQATVLSIKETIIRTYKDSDGYRRTDEDSDGYWRTNEDSHAYQRTEKKYVIEVEFSVDGQKIKKEIIYSRYPTVGQKIEIRYNPQNPYEVTAESTFTIKFAISFIIFFWILLAIIAIIIFRQRQQEINN
jgi:Tfp pilus assembly protein PilE